VHRATLVAPDAATHAFTREGEPLRQAPHGVDEQPERGGDPAQDDHLEEDEHVRHVLSVVSRPRLTFTHWVVHRITSHG
jgi:hypothetical protein